MIFGNSIQIIIPTIERSFDFKGTLDNHVWGNILIVIHSLQPLLVRLIYLRVSVERTSVFAHLHNYFHHCLTFYWTDIWLHPESVYKSLVGVLHLCFLFQSLDRFSVFFVCILILNIFNICHFFALLTYYSLSFKPNPYSRLSYDFWRK